MEFFSNNRHKQIHEMAIYCVNHHVHMLESFYDFNTNNLFEIEKVMITNKKNTSNNNISISISSDDKLSDKHKMTIQKLFKNFITFNFRHIKYFAKNFSLLSKFYFVGDYKNSDYKNSDYKNYNYEVILKKRTIDNKEKIYTNKINLYGGKIIEEPTNKGYIMKYNKYSGKLQKYLGKLQSGGNYIGRQTAGYICDPDDNFRETDHESLGGLYGEPYINFIERVIEQVRYDNGIDEDDPLSPAQIQLVIDKFHDWGGGHIIPGLLGAFIGILPDINDTFRWKIIILQNHILNHKYAHNGYDRNSPTTILDLLRDLNLFAPANPVQHYFGLQYIHSYLHMLDRHYMLDNDTEQFVQNAVSLWQTRSFIRSASLRSCFEALIQRQNDDFLVRSAANNEYLTPYTLEPRALDNKIRQYDIHDGILSDFIAQLDPRVAGQGFAEPQVYPTDTSNNKPNHGILGFLID